MARFRVEIKINWVWVVLSWVTNTCELARRMPNISQIVCPLHLHNSPGLGHVNMKSSVGNCKSINKYEKTVLEIEMTTKFFTLEWNTNNWQRFHSFFVWLMGKKKNVSSRKKWTNGGFWRDINGLINTSLNTCKEEKMGLKKHFIGLLIHN